MRRNQPCEETGDGAPGREEQDQRPGGREELVDLGPQGLKGGGGRRPAGETGTDTLEGGSM